ncbi:ATP-dependent metallopeptidase FtsH/Yme1/Tma family protein, partial [Alistipes ihumii]
MKLNTGNEMPPQLGGKRPKFNIYWVWAAVAVVILSWGLLGSGEVTHPTDWDSVKTMIEQGDVQKIVVVNKETAEVYLKPDKVAEYAGQKDYKGLSAQGPQFAFNIGSLDYFQHNLENTL